MDSKNTGSINSEDIDPGEKIKSLQDEILRLKGYENIVNGFMAHENISLAVFQKVPPVPVFINRGFEILTGYSREEILSFTKSDLENLIHPDMREEFFIRYSKRLQGELNSNSYELKMVRKDGAILDVQAFVYLTEYNNEPSIVITIADITDMREVERVLRGSREDFRLLFDRIPVGVFYFDKDLHITNFNNKFVEKLQSSREKLSGLDLRMLKDQSLMPCIEAAVNGQKGFYKGHYRATTGNAELVISMKTEPLCNEAGEVSGGVGIIEDITNVYEAEEALLKSEENFKEMIDRSPLPIVVIDINDKIVYNNRECFNLFGFKRKDITDLNSWWSSAYPDPAYRKTVVDEWYSGYKNAQIERVKFGPMEYKVTCGDGNVRDIEFHVVPVGDLSFITMNDMTSHRKAEIELLKTKKIESIGILAGGIAHDFNNILTAIIGNLSLVKMDVTEEHVSYSLIDTIEKAAWRARDLTQQLLTFSRGGAPIKKLTSIKQLLVDSATFVLTGTNIKPEFNIADNLWDADIDEGQISQVIHNLVINARESMTECGKIRISAENFNCEASVNSILPESCIKIRIEDSGKGIAQSVIPNIFDPFFTTKGTGTGLGLSVSYSIVKKHGGDIKVSSEEGAGTVFEIFLPASNEKSVLFSAYDNKPKASSGRVLVMDDEEIILDISKKMLSRMGYYVEIAQTGEETISLYKGAMERGVPFDCVIMDLTIPGGMGGRETLSILKEYDPGVAAIVSSGYSNDPVMSKFKEYGFAGVSGKPYSFQDLRDEIERVILEKKQV